MHRRFPSSRSSASFALAACAFLLAALSIGCKSTERQPASQGEASDGETSRPSQEVTGRAAQGAEPEAAAATGAPEGAYRLPQAERVVAIGDVHGDIQATRAVLRLAGALGEDGHWSGGNLVVVQTGDQLDRGDGEREILDLLSRLEKEAQEAGGAVVILNGNHETMNVLGDFRYVTPGAVHSFDGLSPASPHAGAISGPYQSRAAAFLPGGAVALQFAKRPLIVMVGDTVFAHGGLRPEHVRYGIDRLNREVQEFMRGQSPRPPSPMVDPEGPVWTRVYGAPQLGAQACQILDETLRMIGAKRLVIGHTIQDGGIAPACGGKVYRIDVGMSAAYGTGLVQALEITGDSVKTLKK